MNSNGLRLLDYGQKPPDLSSTAEATDRAFAEVADAILAHLGRSSLAPDGLTIQRLPLTLPQDAATPKLHPDVKDPCIRSPWAQISVTPKGLSGAIHWNERQLLRDQSPDANWTELPRPFPQNRYESYAQSYADALSSPGGTVQLPSELATLFALAPQSTRGPFGPAAIGTMRDLAATAGASFTQRIISFIDHCAKGGAPLHFEAIEDLRGQLDPAIRTEIST